MSLTLSGTAGVTYPDGSVAAVAVPTGSFGGQRMKIQAIRSLCPDAVFAMHGDIVEWIGTDIQQPTETEIATEIARLQADYVSTQYHGDLVVAYPDFREYLDGIVKGDQAQINQYTDACLDVKARYPK